MGKTVFFNPNLGLNMDLIPLVIRYKFVLSGHFGIFVESLGLELKTLQ